MKIDKTIIIFASLWNMSGWSSKVTKFWLSKSIIYGKNYSKLSKKNSLNNINLEAHILTTSICEALYFLKWCPIFDSQSLNRFKKIILFIFMQSNMTSVVEYHFRTYKIKCPILFRGAKGQLISKCPFVSSFRPKYQRIFFQDFCPSL